MYFCGVFKQNRIWCMNNITSSIFFGGWSLGGIGSEMIGTMVRSYLASTSVCPISREQKQRDSSPYYFGASGGVVPLSAPWQYRVDYNYWNKTGDSKGDGLVMVIPIRGVLTKESQPSGSGGMDDIASAVEWAYGQEMIVGVVS